MINIFDCAIDLNKSLTKVMPLAAIWFDKPIQTESEKTARIVAGHKVFVKNGRIGNVSESNPANFEVVGCFGNVSDTILYFELKDLKTLETITLNIK